MVPRLSVTIGALEVYYYFAGLVVGCTRRTADSPGDDLSARTTVRKVGGENNSTLLHILKFQIPIIF